MELLRIVKYGNPVLRQKCEPVTCVDDTIRNLVAAMRVTLSAADGVGLAAPQIGRPVRIFIARVPDPAAVSEETFPVFVDPEWVFAEGACIFEEGCLSIPEIYEDVKRAERIRLRYKNLRNEVCEMECSDLPARIILHEYDHLEGKLFVDHLSAFKTRRIKKKLDAIRKEELKLIGPSQEA